MSLRSYQITVSSSIVGSVFVIRFSTLSLRSTFSRCLRNRSAASLSEQSPSFPGVGRYWFPVALQRAEHLSPLSLEHGTRSSNRTKVVANQIVEDGRLSHSSGGETGKNSAAIVCRIHFCQWFLVIFGLLLCGYVER